MIGPVLKVIQDLLIKNSRINLYGGGGEKLLFLNLANYTYYCAITKIGNKHDKNKYRDLPNSYFQILYHSECNLRTKKETSKISRMPIKIGCI